RQSSTRYIPPSYEIIMWLKCPGTFIRHFSQSPLYPMLNVLFIPGCHVHESIVCRDRVWPLRLGDDVVGRPMVSTLAGASPAACSLLVQISPMGSSRWCSGV